MTTSTHELLRIISRDKTLSNIFIDVFPVNELPTLHYASNKPLCLIVNTDASNLNGKHWIALYIDKDNVGEVFDSFGQRPPSYVQRWMNLNTRFWYYTSLPVQSMYSSFCGLFCIYYLYHKARGKSLANILSDFHPNNLPLNDYVVHNFIVKLYDQTLMRN